MHGRSHAAWAPQRRPEDRGIMPTDLTVVMARKAKAKRDSEADVAVASVWLVLYLVMLVGTLTDSVLARAVEFAALY